jgi:hypothetical protein
MMPTQRDGPDAHALRPSICSVDTLDPRSLQTRIGKEVSH